MHQNFSRTCTVAICGSTWVFDSKTQRHLLFLSCYV